jgi:D-alanyl-D-alanine carboxypeptidase
MSVSPSISRRSFVQAAAAATAGVGLSPVLSSARASAATTGSRSGRSPALDRDMAGQLDQAIADTMVRLGIPGSIVGMWTPQGQYVKAFGISDRVTRAPMQTGLNMRIGSNTKTFVAAAVLQLVDQGKVRLGDPIARYVPDVPDGDRITIRELGRMQSGLYPYSGDDKFVTEVYTGPQRSFTPEQLLKFSFSHPLLFAPGTSYVYDNTNYVLLGLVVEKLSSQPLQDYLRDHIFRPLGLSHTVFPAGSEFPLPHAHGYTIDVLTDSVLDATDWNPSWGWAAGAMISTLSDLRRWAVIDATGAGMLRPSTQAERLQTVPALGTLAGARYGFGIIVSAGWVGHLGSIPGYESNVVYLPSQAISLVVLINTDIQVGTTSPATAVATQPVVPLSAAITSIVTPGHVYGT